MSVALHGDAPTVAHPSRIRRGCVSAHRRGTKEFNRLKFGVGRPPGTMDPADFVLRRFSAAERPEVDVMVEEDVPSLATARGARLRAGLDALARRHEWIGDVRGMGLMQGLELVEDRAGKAPSARRGRAVLEAAKAEGLLIGLGGLHGNVVRIGPHLLYSEAEIDELLERLGRACARVG